MISMFVIGWQSVLNTIKVVLHLLPPLAYFVLFLKIINTFLKNNICIL